MSGKFKKDVARSQTLSQISCFSQQYKGSDSNDVTVLVSLLDSLKPVAESSYLDHNRKASSNKRLDACRGDLGSDAQLFRLEFDEIATSDYDLEGAKIHTSDHKLSDCQTTDEGVTSRQGTTMVHPSIFKPTSSNHQLHPEGMSQQKEVDILQKPSHPHDEKFFNMLRAPVVRHPQGGGGGGSAIRNSCGFRNNNNLGNSRAMNNDCSIVYNSCQIDMSCSVSLRIVNEARRGHLASEQRQEVAEEEDTECGGNISTTPSSQTCNAPSEEKQKEVIRDFSQATISRVNHLNSMICEYEKQSMLNVNGVDSPLQRRAKDYIVHRLRLIKKHPFASVSLPNQQQQTAASVLEDSTASRPHCPRSNFSVFHSSRPSLLQLHPHYLSKFSLDIDALVQRDILLKGDEELTFAKPLDGHFPNIILVGTVSGKIQLLQLTKDDQRLRGQVKFSHYLGEKAYGDSTSSHPTCAVQAKHLFYVGCSNGAVVIFDFKAKRVVGKVFEVPNLLVEDCGDDTVYDTFAVRSLELSSSTSLLLVHLNNGRAFLVNKDNTLRWQSKEDDVILRCRFSPSNEDSLVVMTDSKFRIVYIPLDKVIFAISPNVQQFMAFTDIEVNAVTKEVAVLSHSTYLNISQIHVVTLKQTHKPRTIDVLSVQYIIESLFFDKAGQILFCLTEHELKAWHYFNQQEAHSMTMQLLDKVTDLGEALTPSCFSASPAKL